MKRFIILASFLSVMLSMGGGSPYKKKGTEFKGIDEKLQPYVDHFMDLAKENGVTFKRKVSMGIREIPSDRIIGACWYFWRSREIDIDKTFWSMSSKDSKMSLMLHELTHCFCGRDHDYADGKEYPVVDIKIILDPPVCKPGDDGIRAGFYPDGCPSSLMYPTIVEDYCYKTHKKEYEKELFDRCDPW